VTARRLLLSLLSLVPACAFAGDHLVYDRYQDTLDIDAQGRATLKTLKRIKVIDAEGVPLLYGEMAPVYYQKSTQRKEFRCERRDGDNQGDHFFRVVLTKRNDSEGGLLTDQVVEWPGFSKVMAGDTIECTTELSYDTAALASHFYIDNVYPVSARSITITAADPARLATRMLNGESAPPARAGNTLSWNLGPLPALPQHLAGQYLPLFARQLLINYGTLNFFGATYPAVTWAEIAAWNQAVTASARTLDEPLAAQANALAAGAKSDREKASRIFDWVRDNHRYVAVELGKGGWVPRTPAEVDRNKYGDCKDFANLFTAMARAAGLKTAVLRVNTRGNGRIYPDFPAPLVFNHQIGAVWLDDQWVYADATHKFLELGWLRDDVEGTTAQLIPDAGESRIVVLPVSSADDNHAVWTLDARLDEGMTVLSGTHSRHGAAAGDFRGEMEGADSAVDVNNIMQRWLARILPGGQSLTIAGNFHNVHKPIELVIGARVPGLQQFDEGRRYLKLFPQIFDVDVPSGTPEPTSPIYLLFRKHSTLIDMNWILERPELARLPEAQNFTSPFGYFRMTAEKTATGIRVYREFAVTRNEITPAEFPAYKAFILKAQELHNQYYDLGPLTGPPPAAEKPPASSGAKPKTAPNPRKPAPKKPA
jgi:transglutaminase-like putative cysteine protease